MKIENRLRVLFVLGFAVSVLMLITIGIFLVNANPKLPAKTEVSDEYLDVVFYPQDDNLHPGETSTFYFEIINKKSTIASRVDINLSVSYLGHTIYGINDASIRNYKTGETAIISTQQKIPLLTPPGQYLMELSFKPNNADDAYTPLHLTHGIYVQPTLDQILFLLFCILLFGYLSLYFKNIKTDYLHLIVSHKFLSMGVSTIIAAMLLSVLSLDSAADEATIIAYYLLLVGVGNSLLESLRMDAEVTYLMSLCVFSVLLFLPTYGGIWELAGKIIGVATIMWAALSLLKLKKRRQL